MNLKTTLSGLITALIIVLLFVVVKVFNLNIPEAQYEAIKFVITAIGLAIISLFADPNSFKELNVKFVGVLTYLVTAVTGLLGMLLKTAIPEVVTVAVQAILIFLFSWLLTDVLKLPQKTNQ